MKQLILAIFLFPCLSFAGASPLASFKPKHESKSHADRIEAKIDFMNALILKMIERDAAQRKALRDFNDCTERCEHDFPMKPYSPADDIPNPDRFDCFSKCKYPKDIPGGC